MFSNLKNKVGKAGRSNAWTLDSILVGLMMQNDGESAQAIANVLGRSVHSIRVKLFENQGTINGKVSCRSVKRFWYLDHTDPSSETHDDSEKFITALFAEYNEKFISWEDVEARATNYLEILQGKTEAIA